MTRVFTLFFAAAVGLMATTPATAQTVTYPYNPDGNDDQYISIYDLQDLLMAYGQPWTPLELAVDSIPLSVYLQTLQSFIEANALPPGTQAGQFLRWDGEAWVLVIPKVGCTDPEACTYDAEATTLLESMCLYTDACGECDGPGAIQDCGCTAIPVGDCDCDGNQLDALNVCGGTCLADEDGDGICDDDGVDDCVGSYDECGICNGPGAIYDCGCSGIPAGYCDCNGTLDADADGVCDNVDDCVGVPDAVGTCNGNCQTDADGDGICDDDGGDPCDGNLDACGVCNGPGPIYACGCHEVPEGACDCAGNMPDAEGNCQDCLVDSDEDGVYDAACGPCLGQTTTTYQGVEYALVEIGGRCWFKENLKATQYRDGTALSDVADEGDWNALIEEGAYCTYGPDSVYGKLYNGYAAARDLCPQYWDVPSQAEWQALSDAFGGNAASGGALKESGLGHWQSPNAGATNESGFTALPGGERALTPVDVQDLTLSAVFWAKPSYVPQANTTVSVAVSPRLTASSTVLEFPSHSVLRGHSVRCIRALPVLGCTDLNFMEYNPEANVNDGSCATPAVLGCTDNRFAQFDPSANVDDGSCTELLGCEEGTTLTYQGFEYNLVTIGEQCWFVENLEATSYRNGDAIQNLQNSTEWAATNAASVGAWCDYQNDDTHPHAYGHLYNWYAVNDSRGLCPNGWHVPSDGEWTQLTDFLGGSDYAGTPMKASPQESPGWNGTNSSGFTGLPGGGRFNNGYFDDAGNYGGYWWSSSPYGSYYAWTRRLDSYYEVVARLYSNRPYGFSVRCVWDAE
jgi:uncharacterized protein (TIGR02145 family)